LFERVQCVLGNHNRPSYSRRDIAFRGLMQCGYDGCRVTGEIHKEKYVYYRCSGYRGKCDLPRFREADIIDRLGEPLKGLQLGQDVISRIVSALHVDRRGAAKRIKMRRSDLESCLALIRDRMAAAYTDKLDGKIPEEFWAHRMNDWQLEEHRVKTTIERLDRLDVSDRIVKLRKNLELANKAYSLYVSRDLTEKARLLNTLLVTCSIDAKRLVPTYRRPFDMIFNRVGLEEWSQYLSSEFTDS
jgi:site-specific DNA recombinase